jgi:DNA-binding transcriptional MocR family regulator
MTISIPEKAERNEPIYREIANAIGREIRTGRLRPGSRLPTQRALAQQLGVTLTTVTRAYVEAQRRGLISGEVGRGTYIRSADFEPLPGPHEDATTNLSINSLAPLAHVEEISDRLAASIPRGSVSLFEYQPHAGSARSRAAGAAWIARTGLDVSAGDVVVTAGGQHAILVALMVLTNAGDEILVEEFTYPGASELCSRLNLQPRKIPMDQHGLLPDALDAACRSRRARVLYVMPTLQNPTSAVMSEARQRDIAEIARKHDLFVVEDDVYGYLVADATPLSRLLPQEQTLYITSTSKSVAPVMRIGYVRAPKDLIEPLSAAVLRTVVNAPPAMAELASLLIADGTAARIVEWKRNEIAARQEIACRVLTGLRYQTHPFSPHIWLYLPEPWRGESFVAEARQRGVRVNGAEAFAADSRTAVQAIRVCLGPPRSRAVLEEALRRLTRILEQTQQPNTFVV